MIYSHLLKESDDAVRLRLLWVFQRASVPELNNLLFIWVNGEDVELRSAAIGALSQIHDDKVHQLAKAEVKSGNLTGADSGMISLFINN
jgi:hypothetical protein